MAVLSGLIVSVDAFFIGLSLGLQKKCKFLYLVIINAFLFGLCLLGFFIASAVYESIPIEPDLVVGFAFISLGLWTIAQHFLTKQVNQKTIVIVGFVMSIEAMLITMGITIIFLPDSSLIIPITVAFAHFVYSAASFFLARTEYARRIPMSLSQIISGTALIIYGLMALFVEL